MLHYRATLVTLICVAAAIVAFNLSRPPDQDKTAMLPLLQRQGQWPHQHLMGLPPQRRAWVLGQIIESAGHNCEPFSAVFEGVREDLAHPVAYHYVTCISDRAFLVVLVGDPAGTTQVLDCRKAYARKLDCARDWARMPDPLL